MRIAISILFVFAVSFFSSAQELKIGMIIDTEGNQERIGVLKNALIAEIQKTIGSSTKVSIEDQDIVPINWNAEAAVSSYSNLAERCDVIILVGVLSAKTILNNSPLSKPTLAIGITNIELQEIPITSAGTSGVRNFSYVLTSRDIEDELTNFYELVKFKKLAIIVHDKNPLIINVEKANVKLREMSEKFNSEINLVLAGDNIEQSLQTIPDGTDAALVASIYEFDDAQVEEIAQVLVNKKIPSYTLRKDYVSMGIMSSVTADDGYGSLIRKLAIMIDEIGLGVPVENLSVTLDYKKQLFLNLETTYKIGYSPSFQSLFTANLINSDFGDEEITTYGLSELMKKALEVNLGIQISQKDIELVEQDVKTANSDYLPTLTGSLDYTQINEGSTSEFIGQSERTTTESLELNQVLYSENVSANIGIQKYLLEAQKYATQQEINDVILGVYAAYFDILLVQSNIKIQRENLELLKKNLELAQLRRDIGQTNSSDVYRWESEVAESTQTLIEDQTSLLVAKINLNVFLNNTLGEEFNVEDVTLEGELYNFFENNPVAGDIVGPDDIRKTSNFLIEEAIRNYPPRQEFQANIAATERQLKGNKRAYYTPTLSFGATQSEVLDRSGAGSVETDMSNFFDSNWSVGLNLSYPLFDGNRRRYDIQTSKIQLKQLELGLNDFDNVLKFNVKNAIIDVVTSRTNIDFSRISADNSWKNFLIIQDKYRQGTVAVIDLFDAQNTALETKLSFNNSVYNYLVAFVTLENNIGFYSMLSSAEELAGIAERYQEFLSNYDN
ncbi:MAG: TolC family protein [Bacteroidota bacterium]